MISLQDMFYGEREEVWIMKPEKKEKNEPPPKPLPPTPLEENFGPLFPVYMKPYAAPAAPAKKPAEVKTVDMKVPICCEECNESVAMALGALKDVKKVKCDIPKEKVVVEITNDAKPDDILLEVRKVFRKSRFWTKDD
ncbi:unnamed protein product [Calypogeia fissa]